MTSFKKEHIENDGDSRARLIIAGKWLYDNLTQMPVQIFAINYDHYFEIAKADGLLEKEEEPALNDQGEQYLIAWHGNNFFPINGSISYGGITLEEAKNTAQEKVQHSIEWSIHSE
ncbi:hypothetical protein HHL16_13970 [Pseudoflavitalea sp. G-6-1-2]|uniref:hypothetical protein n=1 Tax=Pseudoflavitalea sp. G-6-1-2 TaxID=2728841 RepID=UPI00146E7D41|nr:hypothetical protein [Pseudoflavitalea sp. G-6-1-2]NML21992.1 hypothetical protein [Pseudoflavitalea sp. G-6-1-2]